MVSYDYHLLYLYIIYDMSRTINPIEHCCFHLFHLERKKKKVYSSLYPQKVKKIMLIKVILEQALYLLNFLHFSGCLVNLIQKWHLFFFFFFFFLNFFYNLLLIFSNFYMNRKS